MTKRKEKIHNSTYTEVHLNAVNIWLFFGPCAIYFFIVEIILYIFNHFFLQHTIRNRFYIATQMNTYLCVHMK